LVKGTEFMRRLKSKGCALTVPQIVSPEERCVRAEGLYNPCVALKVDDEIVTNDIFFDSDNAHIYVLTGPNRGGKSVITCAVGISQALTQLGMFTPADNLQISIADAIFTHFPTGADDTIDKGRLGEECARLGEIFDNVTKYSLVLLDESLSSTGSFEASYIAAEVLSGLSYIGCRCLFSTHLHELAAEIDNINSRAAENGGAIIDTLVAGIEEGKRSFKIVRAKPDGKSYARDIANKYGLSYESILEKIKLK
ncbi:MAG: DNA mismatch repair protein, partial [Clostridia bacterium]|nr:DNA mismatch repair protein [Clostridia bacterium]